MKMSDIVSENINVQEAFDNPYPITWEYLKPTGASSAIVKLDDGSDLDIHFSEEPDGVYEIEFARDGSNKQMGRSGQGDEFRVFATVQAAISKWWGQLDKTSAEQITFYANTQDGNRARLYKRFLQMWAKKSKWDIKSNDSGGIMSYTLNKPKKSGAGSIFKRLGFGKKETTETTEMTSASVATSMGGGNGFVNGGPGTLTRTGSIKPRKKKSKAKKKT